MEKHEPDWRHISVTPLSPAIGADIECGDLRVLTDAAAAEIHKAWLHHLVLRFRNQTLSDPDLVTFGRRFWDLLKGTKRPAGMVPRDERTPEINIISNVMVNGLKLGNLGDGEAIWHTDRSHQIEPLSASVLYALEVPPSDGNTSWGNMYLAFETLPDDVKRRVETLSIRHDESLDSAGNPRADFNGTGAEHPIVRTHPETGHTALYLGRRPNAAIVGLPRNESDELLDYLWAHSSQPRFVWTQQWKVGDVMLWDNRCTIHHRTPFDPSSRRVMHRIQAKGTRPYRDADALRRPPHPRGLDVIAAA